MIDDYLLDRLRRDIGDELQQGRDRSYSDLKGAIRDRAQWNNFQEESQLYAAGIEQHARAIEASAIQMNQKIADPISQWNAEFESAFLEGFNS